MSEKEAGPVVSVGGSVTTWTDTELRAFTQTEAVVPRDDSVREGGRLSGLTFSVKDNIDVQGYITSCGMDPPYASGPAERDAEAVRLLVAEGAICNGKTNMPAMAYGLSLEHVPFGISVNPWNAAYWAGGSSTGAAVSVATGLSTLALGTDTGGSIRLPAALNGVTGLRPSNGVVPMGGIVPLSPSFDTVGPIARDAQTLALAYSALVPGSSAPGTRIDHLTVGIPEEFFLTASDSKIAVAVEHAAAKFERMGARLVPVTLVGAEEADAPVRTVVASEASARFHPESAAGAFFYPYLRERFAQGARTEAADVVVARHWLADWNSQLDGVFGSVDLLLTPTCAADAPRLDAGDLLSGVSAVAKLIPALNAYRGPSISFPGGFHPASGVPIGLSFTARPGAESLLLGAVSEFQLATSWHRHVPVPPS